MRRSLALAVLVATACGGGEPARPPYAPPSAQGEKQVAQLTLDGEVPERRTSGLLGASRTRSLYGWMELLDDIRRDEDVAAIFLEVQEVSCGWACTEELAGAFEMLRRSGRKVHCAVEQLDDREYLFAARACDSLAIEPGAMLGLDGLALRQVFLREALASIGLEADFVHIGRYKGAAEPLTRDSMSPEQREQLTELLDSRFEALVSGVAAARKRGPSEIRAHIDRGPFTAREALAAGLVDAIAFSDQVRSRARREAGGEVLAEYDRPARERATADDMAEIVRALAGRSARPRLREPSLVVVYATGPIGRSGGELEGLFGGESTNASSLVPLLEDLAKDENVRAVVLRVDSPGGSPLASDLIWRALRRLDRKKPVVTSMGDVAASGGYYIAVGTRRIWADAATITGSIGVVGGKVATKGLQDMLKVHEETLARGRNASLLSSSRRFTDDERERILALMRQTYRSFVGRVARGRGMTHAQVRAVAEGRIFTGARAKEVGLVDELGTLEDSIAWARSAGNLPDHAPVVRLPTLGGMLEALTGGVGGVGGAASAARPPGALPLALAGLPLPLPPLARRSFLASPSVRRLALTALMLSDEPVLAILPLGIEVR